MEQITEQIRLVLNDQGGAIMYVEKTTDVSPALRAEMGGHPPILLIERRFSNVIISAIPISPTLEGAMGEVEG